MEIYENGREPLFTPKQLRKLILPLVVEQLLAMTVGMADTMMLTSVGEAAVSGVSLVDSISNLIIQVFSALCTGGAVVVSQFLGRGDGKSARMAARQLVYITGGFALFLAALCLLLRENLLYFIFGNMEQAVMDSALPYFLICSLSFPFLAVYNAIAALFRSMGNSRISMFTSFIMNVVNIGGNAFLIYGLHWGAAGAATASLASRAITAIVMVYCIRDPHNPIFLQKLYRIEIRPAMIKSILRVGIPTGMENGMFWLGRLLIQRLITGFGTVAMAANAILNSISTFLVVPGSAIGLAIITVVGQSLGAGRIEEAKGYGKKLLLVIYIAMGLLNAAIIFLRPYLIPLFNLSPEAAAITHDLLLSVAIAHAVLWPTAFPFANILRAAGDNRFTMVVSMSSMFLCRLLLSYVLGGFMGLGLYGVWLAMYTDWVVRFFFFVFRYRSGKWLLRKVI